MRPTSNKIVRKPLCVHTVTVASCYSCMCTEPLTPPTWQINFLNVTLCIGLNYFLFLSTPSTWYYIIFVQPCKIGCSMPAWTFDTFNIPWILQNLLFPLTRFWWESFLHNSNHWPDSWPEIICIFGLSDLVNSLIFADSCPGWHNYSLWGLLFHFHGSICS